MTSGICTLGSWWQIQQTIGIRVTGFPRRISIRARRRIPLRFGIRVALWIGTMDTHQGKDSNWGFALGIHIGDSN